MKLLIQRVSSAKVSVSGQTVGHIGPGLLVFVSFSSQDAAAKLPRAVHKLTNLRIFSDSSSKFNLSLTNVRGDVLVVSQFTLEATLKGHRPGFSSAANPELAASLYNQFIQLLSQTGLNIQSGRFAAHMQVELTNDGPVTILLQF